MTLYAPGCFFFFPWKPLGLAAWGDSYASAYKFFRRDHSLGTNLALHIVALVWQLLGNFGLLTTLDERLGFAGRPLSAVTACMWVFTLLLSPAPMLISCCSSLAIVSAYAVAPYLTPREFETGMICTFVCTLILACLAIDRKPLASIPRGLAFAAKNFGIALVARLSASYWRGTYTGDAQLAVVGVCVVMVALSSLPKPTVPAVLGGVLVARSIGELLDEPALLFFGAAFVAQASQGVAHDVSKQTATLLSHEESDESRMEKLGFEWAHCCYFPNLLLQSVRESLLQTASPSSTKPAGKAARRKAAASPSRPASMRTRTPSKRTEASPVDAANEGTRKKKAS